MTHVPDLHVIDDGWHVPYDLCRRAKLHVGRCSCGAQTVRPFEPELIALMEDEWGVACVVDERARASILALTYDPLEREDIASGEVWAVAL